MWVLVEHIYKMPLLRVGVSKCKVVFLFAVVNQRRKAALAGVIKAKSFHNVWIICNETFGVASFRSQ